MNTFFNKHLTCTVLLCITSTTWADDDCDLGHTIAKVGQTHWLVEEPLFPRPIAPPQLGNSCEFSLRMTADDDALYEEPYHAYYREQHAVNGSYFSYRFSLKLPQMLTYMEDNNELQIFQLKSHNDSQATGRRPLLSLSLTNHPAPSPSSEPSKQWKLKATWGHGLLSSNDEVILKEAFSQRVNITFRWRKVGYNHAIATLNIDQQQYQHQVPSRIKTFTTQLGYVRANKDLRLGNQVEFGVVHATSH